MKTQDYLRNDIRCCKKHIRNLEQKITNAEKELDFWTARKLKQVLEKRKSKLEDLKGKLA